MSGYPNLRLDLPWTPGAIKGYVGRNGPSRDVHDVLQAVAFAIEVDKAVCLFIGLDTLVVTSELTNAVRVALGDEGIDPERILIGASHTHAGPDVFAYWAGDAEASPAEATAAATIRVARGALANLEDADLFWGQALLADVSINRRDEKRGPIDPEVSVLSARSAATGETLGLLVNFACHPITLDYSNLRFSADYVWGIRETVRALHPAAETVFLNGAAGNINPARYPYQQKANIYIPQTEENYPVYWGGFDDTVRMGRIVGTAALQAAERAVLLRVPSIDAQLAEVELPLKRGHDLDAFLEFMNFLPPYRARMKALTALPTEVQRIKLGNLTVIGLPGEPFVELGLELKADIGSSSFIAGYSNDDVRYVLTDDAYDGGQYETVGTPLAVGAASTLVNAARSIL